MKRGLAVLLYFIFLLAPWFVMPKSPAASIVIALLIILFIGKDYSMGASFGIQAIKFLIFLFAMVAVLVSIYKLVF